MSDKCCKDCKDRYIGCHSDCERYKNFKLNREKVKRERIKEYNKFDKYMG